MIQSHPFVPTGNLDSCAECGRVEGSHTLSTRVPVMPDSSDRVIEMSKATRVSGWYVDRSLVPNDPVSQAMPTWIEFIERNPDATLPNGVGGALVAFFKTPRKSSPEFEAALRWHENGKHVSPSAPSVLHTIAILRHFGYTP